MIAFPAGWRPLAAFQPWYYASSHLLGRPIRQAASSRWPSCRRRSWGDAFGGVGLLQRFRRPCQPSVPEFGAVTSIRYAPMRGRIRWAVNQAGDAMPDEDSPSAVTGWTQAGYGRAHRRFPVTG